MAKKKPENFLDLVQQSGLVERDQLKRVVLQLKTEAGTGPAIDSALVGRRLVEAGLLSGWQCEKLLEGRHKGFFVGKYKLLDHLGTGGMSSVYLAEHLLMQRRVAIKVLPRAKVQDASYLARFHREAQAVAALDHRNIVRAYDVDNDGDVHYLVMEYVEGRDLLVVVRERGPLDYPLVADYIRQAADGLAHAHEAGLIHRDVKPANLLVDAAGVVKLLDLGLARFTGEDLASLTLANDENVLGTADYLAPEQAIDSHHVDTRADIYSLGCTVYYLLAGHPPFPDGTLPQRLMMHQKDPPPSIHKDRPDAPDDLVKTCLWMMGKKPDDRPQSAAEVSQLMADWLTAHGHAFDSGSHTGDSSGKLAGVVSAEAPRQAVSKESARPKRRRGSSDTLTWHGIQKAGGAPGPSAGDTAAAEAGETLQPADDSPPLIIPADDSDQEPELLEALPADEKEEQGPPSFDFLNQGDSPAVARLRAKHQMTADQVEAYKGRRKEEVPVWIWIVIGAGTLLAVILAVVFLVNR